MAPAADIVSAFSLVFAIALQSILTLIVCYRVVICVVGSVVKGRLKPSLTPRTRFAIIIPAHNEELTVALAVTSVLRSNYPPTLREVYVIADNCTDKTCKVARQAGATCLDRQDERKGKGYALQWGLDRIPTSLHDGFVILDADSIVSDSFLTSLDHDLQRGMMLIQGNDRTVNSDESWMTGLSDLSDALQFGWYFRARSNLGLSCRLLGNGMCFSREVIERLGWNAFSITENWEHYMNVVLAGYRVYYDHAAVFFSHRAVDFGQGEPQRIRWMSGRAEVGRKYIPTLIADGLRSRDYTKVDSAIDFLLPSQSMLLAAIGFAWILQLYIRDEALLLWMTGITLLEALYCGVGAVMSDISYKTLAALRYAPLYVLWKIWLRARVVVKKEKVWVRTERRGLFQRSIGK